MKKLKYIISKTIFVIGILFLINSLIIGTLSNFNLGIALTFLLGLFLAFSESLYKILSKFFSRRVMLALKYTMIAGICFVAVTMGVIAFTGFSDTAKYNEDAVIVLGAGIRGETVTLTLAHRLDKAIEYRDKNPQAVIVVSGGQGPQESISEALAMKRYLIERGITEPEIIMEDKSTSTYENFVFSKAILDKRFDRDYTVTYITNGFHIYRAGMLAEAVGLNALSCSAKMEWYLLPASYLREFLAVLKHWVIGVYSY